MLDSLRSLDTELLLFFNHLNNPLLDFLFYWISDKWVWVPFYAFLAWVVYKNKREYFFIVLIFIAAAIAISDQLSSALIKEHVMRLRPCHDPAIAGQVHLVNDYCGGQYGFVSSHACNVFTLAAFFSRLLNEKKIPLLKFIWVWATIVSFSRIYLGAHYPGDVICGAILGILVGNLVERVYANFINNYFKQNIN